MGDGDAGEQPAELLVVADGEQQVARDDAGLLVVLGRVAGELQDLRFIKEIGQLSVEHDENRVTKARGGERSAHTSAARYSRTAAR